MKDNITQQQNQIFVINDYFWLCKSRDKVCRGGAEARGRGTYRKRGGGGGKGRDSGVGGQRFLCSNSHVGCDGVQWSTVTSSRYDHVPAMTISAPVGGTLSLTHVLSPKTSSQTPSSLEKTLRTLSLTILSTNPAS